MENSYATMPISELMAAYREQDRPTGYGNNGRTSMCDCDCCSCCDCSDECSCIGGLICCGIIGVIVAKLMGWF